MSYFLFKLQSFKQASNVNLIKHLLHGIFKFMTSLTQIILVSCHGGLIYQVYSIDKMTFCEYFINFLISAFLIITFYEPSEHLLSFSL